MISSELKNAAKCFPEYTPDTTTKLYTFKINDILRKFNQWKTRMLKVNSVCSLQEMLSLAFQNIIQDKLQAEFFQNITSYLCIYDICV